MKIAFIILACACLFLAFAGVIGNLSFMARGQGLPADEAPRLGFLVGMWACPASLFVVAVGFAIAAFTIHSGPRRDWPGLFMVS